jgi:hypothetical protein
VPPRWIVPKAVIFSSTFSILVVIITFITILKSSFLQFSAEAREVGSMLTRIALRLTVYLV